MVGGGVSLGSPTMHCGGAGESEPRGSGDRDGEEFS